MDRKHFLNAGAAWAGGLMLWPLQAVAQQRFPQRAVRIVVPYAAGGNLDLTTRLFAQHLSEEFGQPFVVENRPGANGNTGTEQVVRTAPDGYTLAMVSAGTLARATPASFSLYPRAIRALSASPRAAAGEPASGAGPAGASLSRSSNSRRSAVFLPMPGIRVSRPPSCDATAR